MIKRIKEELSWYLTSYWPGGFSRRRSTAAWTLPAVARRAWMFAWVSKKPISCSCVSCVAYSCSGGTKHEASFQREKWDDEWMNGEFSNGKIGKYDCKEKSRKIHTQISQQVERKID